MSWEINDIQGRGEAPPCAGGQSGLAVVLATGRSVWDDVLYRFDPVGQHAAVIAVNNMILHWRERVHHGVSLHAEEPNLWRALRSYYQCEPSHVHTHSYRHHGKPSPLTECDYIWDIEGSKGGTSTLLAVLVGLALGYERIVLCGAPMDGTGHFYDPPKQRTPFDADNLKWEWLSARDQYFRGRVRSVSGNTKVWLGEPSAAWLRGEE